MSGPPPLSPVYTPIGTGESGLGPARPYPSIDARTAALEALRAYLVELTFYKPGAVGASAVPFRFAADQIHIEQPDHEEDLVFPSIVFESAGEAEIDNLGFYDEDSAGVFGPGTVLWVNAEHQEMINLRIYTRFRADRRAVLAGLERAFSGLEEIYGLGLVCSDYWDQTASFCPMSSTRTDGQGAADNRREATFKLDVRINIVQLANYRHLVALPRLSAT